MRIRIALLALLSAVAVVVPAAPGHSAAGARTVTFVNRTEQTIWVAASGTPHLPSSGWRLPSGKSVSIQVPNKWGGRFWGRTGCHFSMVDGSNLPMWINIAHRATKDRINRWGCETAGCTTPVHCPQRLRVAGPACESPCAKLQTDRYCCRGRFAQGCRPAKTWPINYAKVWKRRSPTPTPGQVMTRPASSPALAAATTGSRLG